MVPESYYPSYYPSSYDRNDRYGYGYGYHYPTQSNTYRDRPYYPRPTLHYPPRTPNRRYDPPTYYPRYRYKDTYYHERERDRNYWGVNKHGSWGTYGGTYGNFGRPASFYGSSPSYGRNHNRYDLEDRRSYHPYRVGIVGGPQDWGRYGGSYGCVTICGPSTSYNYWGFDRHPPPKLPGHRRIFYEPPRPTGVGLIPHTSYGTVCIYVFI